MEKLTVKKVILIVLIIAFAIFLFKYIGVILLALTATAVVVLRYVLKAAVLVVAGLLVYRILKK